MKTVYVEMTDEAVCEDMGVDHEEISSDAVAWHKGTPRREIECESWEDFVMAEGYEFLDGDGS